MLNKLVSFGRHTAILTRWRIADSLFAEIKEKDGNQIVIEAFRSGAVGVCDRNESCSHLRKCIRCVSEGQVWANSRQQRYILETLVEGLPPVVFEAKGCLLSSREQEIVSKVAKGMKNREIADCRT